MNTVRHIRTILVLLTLFLGATGKTWAADIVEADIVIDPGITNGTVAFKSVDNATRTVTLTITPASGYGINRSDITVQKLVDPSRAMAPRRTPAIADALTVDGAIRSTTAADYTFVLPADYAGAYVTATFYALAAATATITPNTLTYNGEAQALVTQVAVSGGAATDPVTYSLTVDGTYTTTISTATNAGTYTVYYKVAPDADHAEGSGSVEVTIQPARLTEVTLVQSAQKYTGDPLTFTVSEVKAGALTVPSTDYDVSGNVQTAIGSYFLTVTGKNNFAGTAKGYYSITDPAAAATVIVIDGTTAASDITDFSATYILATDITASQLSNLSSGTFTGTLDGNYQTISGATHALFSTLSGTVKNVMLDGVSISSGTNVGAIANEANGDARIYNCGILGGSVGGSNYVGGLVGLLDGNARVINCFSYAEITSGAEVGGIVGHNNVATDSRLLHLNTMVMNCMFYGNITGGTNKAPIYNGTEISNKDNTGVGNYNYFSSESTFTGGINTYNCALMAETRFLQRFEFYRHLLNSHLELAGWWVTYRSALEPGDFSKAEMAKWVLEPSQIGTAHPYPILKAPGKYPSVVNYDAENAPFTTERNKGGRLGTLTVNIQMGDGAQYTRPTGATITTSSLTLNITDKDPDHYNFNYYKVQLPYYNDVGTKNYNGNRVVTGWKIVSITGGTPGSYTTGASAVANSEGVITSAPYNFADRKCTNKDLYSVSGRVFAQGAYFDVPEGVTSITIEPYWAKCVYLSDPRPDKVYNANMTTGVDVPNVGGGLIFPTDGGLKDIAGDSQWVHTTMGNAISSSNITGLFVGVDASSHTVYDYAVVLVGNYHHYYTTNNNRGIESSNSKPYTVTSIDLDGDNEPDYSYIMRLDGREKVHPVRVDFLNVPGLGMAQKSTGSSGSYNFGIMQPIDWFEVTNTALFRVTQLEYEHANRAAKPLILHGGVIEQWVSGQSGGNGQQTTYIHVGSNVWFKEFHLGSHQDSQQVTKHPPVSVTGGDYNEFYLTGLYSAANNCNDNAECYINGGRFGKVAGAGIEGLGSANANGNIVWQIQNADIEEFYGGGINAARPVMGNITTVITGSHVKRFCGGPKFGDMNAGRTVITTATNCTFGTYFGAGYGGNSYYRAAPGNFATATDPWDRFNVNWNEWIAGTTQGASVNSGNYPGGVTYEGYKQTYISTFGGVSTRFDYQFLPVSTNDYNVARLFIDFVKFSLATTHNVTSKLTGCTITGNFFGGGSLGKVDGDVTSTLTNCTVRGNAFGGGYDATLPTVQVMTAGFTTPPRYDPNTGTFIPAAEPYNTTTTYTWEHRDEVNSTATAIDPDNHILYTTEDLTTLGEVTGNVTLNIEGNTFVEGLATDYEGNPTDGERGGIFGGGDASPVLQNTTVTINATSLQSGKAYNVYCVYGGGNKADVLGNTTVTMTDGVVNDRIFGGGKLGNVGTITTTVPLGHPSHAGCIEKPDTWADGTGKCTVSVSGGRVGPLNMTMPIDFGYVFGAGQGLTKDPALDADIDFRTYVHDTEVIISGSAFIIGGVYGGSERGRVRDSTYVKIQGGQIGCGLERTTPYAESDWINPLNTPVTANNALPECSHLAYGVDTNGDGKPDEWLPFDEHADDASYNASAYGRASATGSDGHTFYGNVFGGGSGYFPYPIGGDGAANGYDWLRSSGMVEGNTRVDVTGGHILTSLYGGNEMTDVKGRCTINFSGGTLGVPRTLNQIGDHPVTCYLFGAGKGDQRLRFNDFTDVSSVVVNVSGGIIYGSIFGGGEDGHVLGDVTMNISGGIIGTHGTSYVDGNVFGGGRGFSGEAKTAGGVGGNVTMTISGGTMLGSIYGGGRLGSVGSFFVPVDDSNYGKLVPDGKKQVFNSDGTYILDDDASATHGHININISGGTIGNNNEYNYTDASRSTPLIMSTYGGNVFAGSMGRRTLLDGTENPIWHDLGQARSTTLNITGGNVKSCIFGGGEFGKVTEGVTLNINGGTIGTPIMNNDEVAYYYGGIYGGGANSDVNTENWDATANEGAGGWADDTNTSALHKTTVNLHNGVIQGDVYGGGRGQLEISGVQDAIEASVWGDVAVRLNENNGEADETDPIVTKPNTDNCVVKGTIFGCNNLNGTPKGDVLVHIYKTKGYPGHWRTGYDSEGAPQYSDDDPALKLLLDDADDTQHSYEVKAVYGGGNLAAYIPIKEVPVDGGGTALTIPHVIVDGCHLTSIQQVYGGGNAASTPGTMVDIYSTYEIEDVFGGGNGKDDITRDGGTTYLPNPGANVGYKDYSEYYQEEGEWKVRDKAAFDTKDERTAATDPVTGIVYGSGKANMFIHGGRIHHVYGGSNTKGNVREVALTMLEDESGCEFAVDEAYGGGKSAPMDGAAVLHMSCIPGLKNAYGGAEAADIHADVTLNITNGNFDRVFGGNNISGNISGTITVNIEETGCHLLTIGQLFGGGNQAAYSVENIDKTRDDLDFDDPTAANYYKNYPVVNVKSFSSIGEVYGGGYGRTAALVGNPHVNIDVCQGNTFPVSEGYAADKLETEEAAVATKTGNRVLSFVEYQRNADGSFVLDGEGKRIKEEKTISVYMPPFIHGGIGRINNVFGGGYGADVDGDTYVRVGTREGETITFATGPDKTAQGAIITGNIFGGGNAAEVTGDSHVTIGKQ